MHKLHLAHPLRYSEDLDYVRTTAGGIKDLTQAVTAIGERLGMEIRTRIGEHPKIILRAPFESGAGDMRVKVEVNTFERSPAYPLVNRPYRVESSWFTDEADVLTFTTEELIATKIRALFQRSKGRDLFDLWLALTQLGTAPQALVDAFAPYRPDKFTSARAVANLREKLTRSTFREDLRPLVDAWPQGSPIEAAADLVISEILGIID